MSRFTDALKATNNDPGVLDGYEDAVQRERFIKTLVQMRLDAGLSQEEVARAIGVGQSTVSQFENATDPRLSTVQRYARAVEAQLHFVAASRTLQPKAWTAPEMVQRPRINRWAGVASAAVRPSRTPSAYAKAA